MKDKHHILHYRQEWTLRPEARSIREHPSLIPFIPRELHTEIHKECPPVPMLGYHALKRVATDWYPARDTLESLSNLTSSIEDAIKNYRTHPIEREVGYLVMEALELQRSFLREAL